VTGERKQATSADPSFTQASCSTTLILVYTLNYGGADIGSTHSIPISLNESGLQQIEDQGSCILCQFSSRSNTSLPRLSILVPSLFLSTHQLLKFLTSSLSFLPKTCLLYHLWLCQHLRSLVHLQITTQASSSKLKRNRTRKFLKPNPQKK
jgi:hypothetical protein